MKTKKVISIFLSILITFLLIREVLRLGTGDYATAVIPGWHTTIYPNEWMLTIGALFIGIIAFLAFILFKGIKILLTKIFSK